MIYIGKSNLLLHISLAHITTFTHVLYTPRQISASW